MKYLILILLIFGFANAQEEKDAQKDAQKNERHEALRKSHSAKLKCQDTSTDLGSLVVRGPLGSQEVQLIKNKKKLSTIPLPTFGGKFKGSAGEKEGDEEVPKCLEMQKYFPKQKIAVYRVFKGTANPSLIQDTVLVAYKIEKNKITHIEEFVILEIDPDGELLDLESFTFAERDGIAFIDLKDELEADSKPIPNELGK